MNINKPSLQPRHFYAKVWFLLITLVLVTTVSSRWAEPQTKTVIVTADDLATAVQAINSVGGITTHELGIINGVGAKVTAAQYGRLTEMEHLRLYQDAPLEIATDDTSETVRDEFILPLFSNQNGSQNWSGNWREIGENNGPLLGDVAIFLNRLVLKAGNNAIQRSADLSGASTANLSFDYRRDGFDNADDYVVIEVSSDGGANWAELMRISGPGSDRNWQTATQDLTLYLHNNITIRFQTSRNLGSSDKLLLDNVQIQYASNSSSPIPMTLRDELNGLLYSSNNGSVSWDSAWQEIGENDGPLSGLIGAVTNTLCTCLNLGNGSQSLNNRGLSRRANLSAATSAILSFSYQRLIAASTAGQLNLDISNDGGLTWTTLSSYELTLADSNMLYQSLDISPFISPDTQIRFIGSGDALGINFLLDNIQIDFIVDDVPGTTYTRHIGADQLHNEGITGDDITIAVIDTGYWSHPGLDYPTDTSSLALGLGGLQTLIALGQNRVVAHYDAIQDQLVTPVNPGFNSDAHGHGAHVTSVALNSQVGADGAYNGIAPDANLVAIKALGPNGSGTYLDVIRAIDWVVANKDSYNIRILNLSLSAQAHSYYWDDPLNQAVMRAWQSGIVVVTAAGNRGPEAMTVGVPGNLPYIISVGAMSDNGTGDDLMDDFLTSFSSVGPTVEGFVKPEMVAPGGHLLGLVGSNTTLAQNYPQFRDGDYMTISGTSQATAVTSGVVALMLQADPTLTPDTVKCRLMATTRTAVNADGSRAYSIFQQGAGQINAYEAVHSTASGCANRGLNIAADLDGSMHFGGPANIDENGNYYLMDSNGYMWADNYTWAGGYMWADGYMWDISPAWSSIAGIEDWVPQQ